MMKTTNERVAAIKQRCDVYKARRKRHITAAISVVSGLALTVCAVMALDYRVPETVAPEHGDMHESITQNTTPDSSPDEDASTALTTPDALYELPVSVQITKNGGMTAYTDIESITTIWRALKTVVQSVSDNSESADVSESTPEIETPASSVRIAWYDGDGVWHVSTVKEDTYIDSEGTRFPLTKAVYETFVSTLETIGE